MSNARPADPLGFTAAHEWHPDFTKPAFAGPFERKSAVGTAVDYWDGKVWRRKSRHGVECANQKLPWRAAP